MRTTLLNSPENPALHPSRKWAPCALLAATALIAWAAAMAGSSHLSDDPRLPFIAILTAWARAGWPAILSYLCVLGLGQLSRAILHPSTRESLAGPPLANALGLAIFLFLSNITMSLGAGSMIAWCIVILGITGIWRSIKPSLAEPASSPRSPWRCLALAPSGLLIAAACNPPGWLFDSEFRGYDSLAYHLALPQEWLTIGRLQPLQHNLFSYFPGFVESSFMFMGRLSFAPSTPDANGCTHLLADDGHRLLSGQMFHALVTIHAAWSIGPLVRLVGQRLNAPAIDQERAVAASRLAFLLTPWIIVVGALSYNEMPMLIFASAGFILLLTPQNAPSWRDALVLGILTGAAIGAKPTAILFVAAPLAICAFFTFPPRTWLTLIPVGLLASLLLLSPWLIRNALHADNPVFPFALHALGTGHWTAEQVARFESATRFDGSLLDRLRLLILPDPNDPAGIRHRGLMHPQWLWLFGLSLTAAAASAVTNSTARPATRIIITFVAVQFLAWITLTHIQARFLLPCVPFLVAFLGIAVMRWPRWGRVILPLLALRGLATCDWYAQQCAGSPNALLFAGPSYFTGHAAKPDLEAATSPDERREILGNIPPSAAANLSHLSGVYLIGDATSLYWNRPIYNSTWDSWPIVRAMHEAGNDLWAINDALNRMNIRHVLLNEFELERLARSKLIDPRADLNKLRAWARECTQPEIAWPKAGSYLLRLKERPKPGD